MRSKIESAIYIVSLVNAFLTVAMTVGCMLNYEKIVCLMIPLLILMIFYCILRFVDWW